MIGDHILVQPFSCISFHVEWLKEKKSSMMKKVSILGNQDKAMASRVVRWNQGGSMALLRWCLGGARVVLGWFSGGSVPLTLPGAAWSRRSVEEPTQPRTAPTWTGMSGVCQWIGWGWRWKAEVERYRKQRHFDVYRDVYCLELWFWYHALDLVLIFKDCSGGCNKQSWGLLEFFFSSLWLTHLGLKINANGISKNVLYEMFYK